MDLLNDPIIKPPPANRGENCPAYIEMLFYTRPEGAGDKMFIFSNAAYSFLAKLGVQDTVSNPGVTLQPTFPQNIFVPTWRNFSFGNLTVTPAERPGFPIVGEDALVIYSAESLARHLQSNAYIINRIEAYLAYNAINGTVAASPSNYAINPLNMAVIQQNHTGDMANNSGVTLHPAPNGVVTLFYDPNPNLIYYQTPPLIADYKFLLNAQTSLIFNPPAGFAYYDPTLTSEYMLVRLYVDRQVSTAFQFH